MIIPTSNSFAYQLSSFDIIKQAYMWCGYQTSTLEYVDFEFARNQINLIFTDWTSKGYDIFNTIENVIPIVQGQTQVTLPMNTFDVIEASIRTNVSDQPIDAPLLNRVSVNTYQSFPDKTSQSSPTMFYLWRGNTPNVAPIMYIYPTPSNDLLAISYFAITQMQDLNSSSINEAPGIPYRWLNALVTALAVPLCLYKNKEEKYQILAMERDKAYMSATAGDADIAPLEIIWDLNSVKRWR